MSHDAIIPGKLTDDLVIVDLETTGLDPRAHEIIEIGAVRLTDDLRQEKGAFSVKVLPTHPESAMPEALAVNGYTPEGWLEAVPLADGLQRFAVFGAGAMLVGYNITFDWEFLHSAFSAHDIPGAFPYHRLDVFSLAFEWLKKQGESSGLDLASVCRHFSIAPPPQPHRALADARAAAAVLGALRRSSGQA